MVENVQGKPATIQIAGFRTSLQEFIEAIDGIDNGVPQYPTDIKPRYRSRTDLSRRVGYLNPAWNEPFDSQSVDVRGRLQTISRIPLSNIRRAFSKRLN